MDEIGREDLLAYWKGILLFLSNHGWIEPDKRAEEILKLIEQSGEQVDKMLLEGLGTMYDRAIVDIDRYEGNEEIDMCTEFRKNTKDVYIKIKAILQQNEILHKELKLLEELAFREELKEGVVDEATVYPPDHEPEMVAKHESGEQVDEGLIKKWAKKIEDLSYVGGGAEGTIYEYCGGPAIELKDSKKLLREFAKALLTQKPRVVTSKDIMVVVKRINDEITPGGMNTARMVEIAYEELGMRTEE